MSKETITVCSACLKACCWHGRFMCDKAPSAGTVEKTKAELAALNREHPSYWRDNQTGIPQTAEEVVELAEWMLKNPNGNDDAQLFASYLTEGECGLDPVMVKEALREVWPAASEAVWLPETESTE